MEIELCAEIRRLRSVNAKLVAALEDIAVSLKNVLSDSESQHPGGWGPDVTTLQHIEHAAEIAAKALRNVVLTL